jgi:acetolactate synthase-1/3 small subunit
LTIFRDHSRIFTFRFHERCINIQMIQRVYSILVDNTSGVLSRVAGLFSRRGYNIDSLTVGVTADPKYSRMTIVTTGDDELVLDQIGRQLAKLVDVRDIKVLKTGKSVNRELILVKVKNNKEQRRDLIELSNIFRAKIVDVGINSTIVELTGTENKLNAFLRLLGDYEILELARTGITGLSRGMDDVTYL